MDCAFHQLVKSLTRAYAAAARCRIEVFGSNALGTALPTSDIDLAAFPRSDRVGEHRDADLSEMSESLERARLIARPIIIRPPNAPPVLQCIDRRTLISVEITPRTDRLARRMEIMQRVMTSEVKQLVRNLRMLLNVSGLHDAGMGGVGGHLLNLWCAAFIHAMREHHTKKFQSAQLGNMMDFLRVFGNGPFSASTTRIVFDSEGRCRIEPKPATVRGSRLEEKSSGILPDLLCVIDPVSRSDVGRQLRRIREVREQFFLTHEDIMNLLSGNMTLADDLFLQAYFHGTDQDLRSKKMLLQDIDERLRLGTDFLDLDYLVDADGRILENDPNCLQDWTANETVVMRKATTKSNWNKEEWKGSWWKQELPYLKRP